MMQQSFPHTYSSALCLYFPLFFIKPFALALSAEGEIQFFRLQMDLLVHGPNNPHLSWDKKKILAVNPIHSSGIGQDVQI